MAADEKCSVLYGKYELGRFLGHGTFAKVYHARNMHTGKSSAMKVVGKEKVVKAGMMEQIKREISVMELQIKSTGMMELVRGGELFAKISNGRLREELLPPLSAFSDHLRHDGLLHTTCGTPAYVGKIMDSLDARRFSAVLVDFGRSSQLEGGEVFKKRKRHIYSC